MKYCREIDTNKRIFINIYLPSLRTKSRESLHDAPIYFQF